MRRSPSGDEIRYSPSLLRNDDTAFAIRTARREKSHQRMERIARRLTWKTRAAMQNIITTNTDHVCVCALFRK